MSLVSSTGGNVEGGGKGGGGDTHQTHTDQQTDYTPRLETYVEMFLTVLIILNHRRRQKPAGQSQL